ncbi:MAG: hypothetical protein QOE05_2846, partial [Actinomycetota bacterium]|nr:hypothetical protein [Actinomycetota bacterium]
NREPGPKSTTERVEMDSSSAYRDEDESLAAEVRESFMLLGVSVGITAAVTVFAQFTLTLLG